MKCVKVVNTNNIGGIKLENYIDNSSNLFITSTRSLSYKINNNIQYNVIDFTQLQSLISKTTKEQDCIKESEMRYLLYKTIMDLKDDKIKIAFKNSIDELYSLFDKLLISNVRTQDINLTKIRNTYLTSNASIFELYINYLVVLSKQSKKPYQVVFNDNLKDYFNKYEKVSLIGFTFFNDIQNTMVKILTEQKKLANIFVDDEIIFNDFVVPYLSKLNIKYETDLLGTDKHTNFDELKNTLFTHEKPNQEISNRLKFYKPFFTREMEFEFIIEQISNELKKYSTRTEIENACEKYAVVITNQFSKHTKIFNDILKRIGVFISPDNKIFYSQNEYLKSNYDKKRTKEERLKTFANFARLEMYEPPKTFFNSLVGRFVCEIYKIAGRGLKLSNFNTLLNINWLFKKTAIDDIISEFNVIKDFFENLTSINDWVQQINNLIIIKKDYNFEFESELRNHPLKAIRLGSLEFIRNYIYFLSSVISQIQNVDGSVKEHITTLINAIKSQTNEENLENELLLEFADILSIKDDGINIEFSYFAENFITLINEYISSKNDKSNNIRLNAINLESAACYDTVFLPMFEENKYPMLFKCEFPYTKQIVSILQDNSLINGYILPLNKTLDYNLTLSKYVFKNLFNIAQEKIIFTRLDSENGTQIEMSIFGNEILSKFDNLQELTYSKEALQQEDKTFNELYFKDVKIKKAHVNDLLYYFVCPKMFYNMMLYENKNCYTDKFLLNFYCKALIVNQTLIALTRENTIHINYTFSKEVDRLFNIISQKAFELIPLFDDNSKNDILLTAKRQLKSFVNDKILNGRFKPENEFAVITSREGEIIKSGTKIDRYKSLVTIDNNTKKSNVFDISRSLDCLISSCGGKQTTQTHFWDIVAELCSNKFIDRLNSLNLLNFKINTQLNTPRFVKDGLERIGDIVDYIKQRSCSNLNFEKSAACAYCKFKNTCMGGVDYD